MNVAEEILAERALPHDGHCAILHGDIICSCGASNRRKAAELLGLSDLGNSKTVIDLVRSRWNGTIVLESNGETLVAQHASKPFGCARHFRSLEDAVLYLYGEYLGAVPDHC